MISLRFTVRAGGNVTRINGFRSHASLYTNRYFSTKLTHPSTVDQGNVDENSRGRIVCITSGKGGVGKTTSAASFALGLASVSIYLHEAL